MIPIDNSTITSQAPVQKILDGKGRWFIAKIIFNIITGRDNKSQFEEQIRLVEAESTEEAFLKARAIGIGEEEILVHHEGRNVEWKFVDVADLIPLQSFRSGLEIYSQIHEIEESQQYIHSIHQRGMNLRIHVQQAVA